MSVAALGGGAVQNIYLLSEAEKVTRAFRSNKIPLLFLKGIALLETVYPNLNDREISDIDLLIRPGDLERGAAVLKTLGYEPVGGLDFVKKGALWSRLDLHYTLWYFDEKKLWCQAWGKSLGNTRILIPSPFHLFLHAVLHAVLQDGRISETSMEDCRRILSAHSSNWDWKSFRNFCREEGWEKITGDFLLRLNSRFSGVVPQTGVNDFPKSRKFERIVSREKSAYARMWLAQERLGKKIRMLFGVLCPPLGFLKMRYPGCPTWFLPVVRPLLLGAELLRCRKIW